jgi:hypothetical protein
MIDYGFNSSAPRYVIKKDEADLSWVEVCDTKQEHPNGVGRPVARVLNEPMLVENVLIGLNYPYSLC